LQFNFAIDKEANDFVHVRLPYGMDLLPDNARDVLYKITIYFKFSDNPQPYLLLTAWFAYDLESSYKRFEQYYRVKYIKTLQHTRYYWISLDGKQNLVAGHEVTNTNKPVNTARLASLYQNWWPQTQPVNSPTVLERVKSKPQFYAKYATMLNGGQFLCREQINIIQLQPLFQAKLQQKILEQRINIVSILQSSQVIPLCLDKIDAYNAVLTVFKQILHIPCSVTSITTQFTNILSLMQNPGCLQQNLEQQLNDLLSPGLLLNSTPLNYEQGIFYQKIDYMLSQLRLLLNTLPTPGLSL